MTQPPFNFQPPLGPGSTFKPAPNSHVKNLIFQFESPPGTSTDATRLANHPQHGNLPFQSSNLGSSAPPQSNNQSASVPPQFFSQGSGILSESLGQGPGASPQSISYTGVPPQSFIQSSSGVLDTNKNPTMNHLLDLNDYKKQQELRDQGEIDGGDESGESEDDEEDPKAGSAIDDQETPKVKRRPRGQYRKYTDKHWERTLNDLTENFGQISMTAAAKKYGINGKTGRTKLSAYMENPNEDFPTNKPRGGGCGRPKLLQEEHTKFILDFFGNDPEKDVVVLLQWVGDRS
ncbi:hypothetical protein EMPS_04159 [Entomortierella parvispora]|uniref:Uncharacterized protein n=1 Tax=Entomortierella parvispora TaxID=205924 RepID=A0A9P3H860_9FUNG|nr:hypothetical protein EMPS_04159 [Entomortierella parvispora]